MDPNELANFMLQQMSRIPPPSAALPASQLDNPRPIMATVDNLKDGISRSSLRGAAEDICIEHFTRIGWQWEPNKPGTQVATTLESVREGLQQIANALRELPSLPPAGSEGWNGDSGADNRNGSKQASTQKSEPTKKRPAKRSRESGGVDKASKGLRHLSLRVCQKVELKGETTYGEVADELVAEILGETGEDEQSFDEKNIRRRVYDALNVLLAMDMICKDKKAIRWIGLPTHTQIGLDSIRAKKANKIESISRKRQRYSELCEQKSAYHRVMLRNTQQGPVAEEKRIYLPFVVVKTSKQNNIDCEVTEDYAEIFFNFTSEFEILDDMEILRRMGMHQPES